MTEKKKELIIFSFYVDFSQILRGFLLVLGNGEGVANAWTDSAGMQTDPWNSAAIF